MPIQTSCPTCQRQLRVPDNLIGQMVKCPSCQNTFVAAAEETAAPPAPEETPRESSSRYREEEPAREGRRPRDADDEQTRPSRRSTLDDDELDDDERPRRKRYKPHRGQLIMILGILGIIGVGAPITGIVAWVLGNSDMAQIRAGTMDPEGESNTSLGRILGMVSSIIWGLIMVFACTCGCLIPMIGKVK